MVLEETLNQSSAVSFHLDPDARVPNQAKGGIVPRHSRLLLLMIAGTGRMMRTGSTVLNRIYGRTATL